MASKFSFRVARILGIPVHVHLLYVGFVVIVTVQTPGYARAQTALSLLVLFTVLFTSILLHELGHCLMARRYRGRVHDIEIGLLGGVSRLDYAAIPRVQLAVSLAGIGVNLLLALLAGGILLALDGRLPGLPYLRVSPGAASGSWEFGRDVLVQTWNLNLLLPAFNLLPGIPFDGGKAVETLFWKRYGRPRARLVVLGSGAVIGLGLILIGLGTGRPILTFIGIWGLWECASGYQELRAKGLEEEAFLGVYDFSEGHTSLDVSAPPPDGPERKKEKERERARKAAAKREREEHLAREAARDRVDALLDRISREGMTALTPEERAFLVEESRRLKAAREG